MQGTEIATPSENLALRLVEQFPELASVMEEHLEDQEGELLPPPVHGRRRSLNYT